MNLPTLITTLRIVLVPVFALIYLWPGAWTYWVAAGLFSLAALTDWLDGYLARRLQQTTRFGAFIDPSRIKSSWSPRWSYWWGITPIYG